MERLLQQFEQPVTDKAGHLYTVFLFGRSRPGDTWQGWLVFERVDGTRFSTDVETTQPNAEAVLYWATGLTGTYFDGALERALKPAAEPSPVTPAQPATLADIERAVLACFTRRQTTRAFTQAVFDELPWSHASVVRALEDLEKQGGLLVRRTEEGNDLLFLTHRGIEAAGVTGGAHADAVVEREIPRLR